MAALFAAPAWADAHGTYTQDTSKCYSCHSSHYARGLLVTSQPTISELCYSCHDGTGSSYDVKGEFGLHGMPIASAHPVAGARLVCNDCHNPHTGPRSGNPMALAAGPSKESTGTAVCGACHGRGSTLPGGDLIAAYTGTAHEASVTPPASGSRIACLACHRPHGSANASLLTTNVVGMSGTTRTVSVDAASGTTPVCTACHDIAGKDYAGPAAYAASKHATVATSSVAATGWAGVRNPPGDCANCHDPHGTGNAKMTRAPGEQLCFGCHDATGTVRPSGYSYRGAAVYAASAHEALAATATGGPNAGTGCTVCHTVHGGGQKTWDGRTPAGSLRSAEVTSCTGSGTGACHGSAANSVGGVDVASALVASADNSAHHDLTASSQQATGARISCSDCHNPHRETAESKYSDPSDLTTGMAGDLARFVDGSGRVYAMVAAEHDGIAPVITGVTVDASAGTTSPVIAWSTDEPATTWVDWGSSTAYEAGAFGANSPLSTSHTASPSGVLVGATYHFRVRSADALGNERVSPDRTYTATALGAPMLLAPVNTTVFWYIPPTKVTFSWTPVTSGGHAIVYDVVIRSGNGSVYKQLTRYLPANPASPSWQDTNFPNTTDTFTWTVRAYDSSAGVNGPWSPQATFYAAYAGDAMVPAGVIDLFASIFGLPAAHSDTFAGGVQVAMAEPVVGVAPFSVDTDRIEVQGRSRTAASVTYAPVAAWQSGGSVSATPTPFTPGTPASAVALALVGTQDGMYWSTGLATADREWNRQVFRFDLESRGAAAASEILLSWTGHGEPTPTYATAVYLWDFSASTWVDVTTRDALGTDATVSKHAPSVPDSLCLRCHSGSLPPGVVAPASRPATISSVWTTATPSDLHGPRPGTGASVSTGGLSGYARGDAVTCGTCHDPHGSASPFHLSRHINGIDTMGAAGTNKVAAACVACHTGGSSAWHSGCISCHRSLGPNHTDPAVDFSNTANCLACHGHGRSYTHGCGAASCHPGGGGGPWTYPNTF